MLNNNYNPISIRYNAHDLFVGRTYNCILEGVRNHVINLTYRCMVHTCSWYNPLAFFLPSGLTL